MTAFENLCQVGAWRGLAVICAENDQPFAHAFTQLADDRWLLTSNRWSILLEAAAANPAGEPFSSLCQRYGFTPGESTALLVDIDKTAIGARGRNAHVIDRARQVAALETARQSLGNGFDPQAFTSAYRTLSQPDFHPLTEDNQDYLAYICLVLTAGFTSLDELALRSRQDGAGPLR